ncbi:MAG: aldo/keto reductase [Verrucomicrobiota bacterium JB022]|nr:aldo/keto reductase [Verrucomicrobiota bacterium JB022]
MKYRAFGKLGWEVSEIGFGGWALGGDAWGSQDDRESVAALQCALEAGVNLIDTAARYGNGRSERVIAEALQGRREKAYLVTKTPPVPGNWPPHPYESVDDRYPAAYLRENVEERLRNLQTDCLDVLLLHVWSRSWNADPRPLEVLAQLKQEGKIRAFGISTPDNDQDQLNTLMLRGQIDVIQIVYNIFEQLPAAEALPLAQENGVAVMGRVAFDEGSLTGKFTSRTRFGEGEFRNRYFAGDRLVRTVERVERVREDLRDTGYTMAQAALKFALAHPAISTVIPGMRNVAQAEANVSVSDLPDLPEPVLEKLRRHIWLKGNWYAGK